MTSASEKRKPPRLRSPLVVRLLTLIRACCTSAAPWYVLRCFTQCELILVRFFKPQAVGKIGLCQDGGLLHNCPSDIAHWETRFVWPNKPHDPDFALSLGTGIISLSEDKSGIASRSLLRIFDACKQWLNAQKGYARYINSVPLESRSRYHRLNIQFHGPEPSLDDALKIPEMKDAVAHTVSQDQDGMIAILDAMIASLFYFELDGLPETRRGELFCSGHIYCRADLRADGLRYLYTRLRDTSSWFLVQGNPVKCVERIPKSLPPFKRKVGFRVKHDDELVTISIRGITRTSISISGFPTTVRQLVMCQRLDVVFGTVDHMVKEKPLPAIPRKRSRDDSQASRCNPKRACSSIYST
jgi:hypothetical protein